MWDRAVGVVASAVDAKGNTKRKWKTLKGLAGRKSVSEVQRGDLQAALEDQGIYPRPRLDLRAPSGETYIKFSRRPYEKWEHGFRFKSEKELRQAVLENWRHLPPLADLYAVKTEVGLTDRQGRTRRVDMVAKRPSGQADHRVLIEFERHDGHGETATQLLGYLKLFRGTRADPQDQLEAMVISQGLHLDAYEDLRSVCDRLGVKFRWLVTSLELVDADPIGPSRPSS